MIQYFLYGMLAGIGFTIISLIITIVLLSRDAKQINDREWEA